MYSHICSSNEFNFIKNLLELSPYDEDSNIKCSLKPVFHLANLFARREAKTRIRQRDWLTLAGEKILREQVGTVPTFFLFARTNSPSGKRA